MRIYDSSKKSLARFILLYKVFAARKTVPAMRSRSYRCFDGSANDGAIFVALVARPARKRGRGNTDWRRDTTAKRSYDGFRAAGGSTPSFFPPFPALLVPSFSHRSWPRVSLFHYFYLITVITISVNPTAPMNRREVSFPRESERRAEGKHDELGKRTSRWRERRSVCKRGKRGRTEEDGEKKEDEKEEGDRTKKELGNRGERSLLRGFVVGPLW